MSRIRQVFPADKRRSQLPIKRAQTSFAGMLKGIPASEVGDRFSWRNRNVIDHGKFYDVRPGSYSYGGPVPTGNLNAREVHDAMGVIVWQFGTTVYVSDKDMVTFTEVLNFSSVDPDDIVATDRNDANTMVPLENDMILGTRNGVFRIVLDEDYYYMYRINVPAPDSLITDIAENAGAGLIYGYIYVYSMARIDGVGNRSRMIGDATIVHETATCWPEFEEKDFAEVYFDSAIGEDVTVDHVIGEMTVPDDVDEITHFSVYRSKNIGGESGGTDTLISELGNSPALLGWVEDVPVCKCWTVVVSGNVAWRSFIDNAFEYADVGSDLALIDVASEAASADSVAGYNTADAIDVAAVADGTYIACIGGGRLFRASQIGYTVTVDLPAAGVFQESDVGLPIFTSMGTRVHITAYMSATVVTVAEDLAWGPVACTMKPTTGNFHRNFNDVTPDTYQGTGVVNLDSRGISFESRLLSGEEMYIPLRFYIPLPNCNVIAAESGFLIAGVRGATEFQYSEYGRVWFRIGNYRIPQQSRKIETEVKFIWAFANGAAIFGERKVVVLNLSTYTEMGNTKVDYCAVLPEPYTADKQIGVLFWQSIKPVRPGAVIAVTSEPAVRVFDGRSWSARDFAVEQSSGDDAVGCELKKIDPTVGCVATYSPETGYILWFYKWVDTALDGEYDDSDRIYDNGGVVGSTSAADEVYNDVGGALVPADDTLNDNGGSVWQ